MYTFELIGIGDGSVFIPTFFFNLVEPSNLRLISDKICCVFPGEALPTSTFTKLYWVERATLDKINMLSNILIIRKIYLALSMIEVPVTL